MPWPLRSHPSKLDTIGLALNHLGPDRGQTNRVKFQEEDRGQTNRVKFQEEDQKME